MTARRRPRAEHTFGDTAAQRGRYGEDLAHRYLVAAGYRCEARNLRTRGGELDLLVRRRRQWVAVEVKTRSLEPAPELLVDDAAVARLARALDRLAPHLRPRPRLLRVDIVAVRLTPEGPEVRHFQGQSFAPGTSGQLVVTDDLYKRGGPEL